MRSLVIRAALSGALFLLTAPAFAQAPKVEQVPTQPVKVVSGKSSTATFVFRVAEGMHVNSDKPLDELLVPTTLKLQPPTQLMVAKINYPEGELMNFPFSPEEKLSLYTGDFGIKALVRVVPGTGPGIYRIKGELKYQACNNRQCFPPKSLPVILDVKVSRK